VNPRFTWSPDDTILFTLGRGDPAMTALREPLHFGVRPQPLFDLDPDLGCDLDELQQQAARRICRAGVVTIPAGPWSYAALTETLDTIVGVIVVDGIVGRELALNERRSLNLLTAGDVLLAPTSGGEDPLGHAATLTAMTRATVAVLDESFIHAAARWPSLLARLHERLALQQAREAAMTLVLHLPRAEDRVLMTLWLLAQQCGRMTGEGLMLPLSFTHEALSQITAARRPTISLALRQLQGDGTIVLRADGQTLLTHQARARVQLLTAAPTGGCEVAGL
jgi:CRP-like cAMP-binding protein